MQQLGFCRKVFLAYYAGASALFSGDNTTVLGIVAPPELRGSCRRASEPFMIRQYRERKMESRGEVSGGGVWGRRRSPQRSKPAEPFPVQPGAWGA
jgi:hypothetical protein